MDNTTGGFTDDAVRRQRAYSELLRQEAQRAGMLDAADAASPDGVLSEAASNAIERLLERELRVPEPDEPACRRHYAAHPERYHLGTRVRLRHILFAVTPGVDVRALRQRAEQTLLELRCDAGGDLFAERAAALSNCPSGARGGELGWLGAADCAPEFAREVLAGAEVGVLARLVHSRFGLHVVQVLEREAGTLQPYEEVEGAVRLALRQQAWVTALRQYLQVLSEENTALVQ
jgi:peptidyl-prolyl cis-trans isomerase C